MYKMVKTQIGMKYDSEIGCSRSTRQKIVLCRLPWRSKLKLIRTKWFRVSVEGVSKDMVSRDVQRQVTRGWALEVPKHAMALFFSRPSLVQYMSKVQGIRESEKEYSNMGR